jgi:hypothetical protein
MLFCWRVTTSESMIPRPCFQALNTVYIQFCYMFVRSDIYFRLYLLLIIITTTCISLSLRWTSAPIHLTSVLGVLGTQETFCIVIARLFERDSFDLLLPEFDKPWVIHLRETCCCSKNLCTWRSNTVYKNRRVHRHQLLTARVPAPDARGDAECRASRCAELDCHCRETSWAAQRMEGPSTQESCLTQSSRRRWASLLLCILPFFIGIC